MSSFFLMNKDPKNKKKISSMDTALIISDLDTFFRDIYEYYNSRGYYNILTQAILDNVSYLFSLHFVILNVFVVNWTDIVTLCVKENNCSSDVLDYIQLDLLNNFLFITIYSVLMSYYLIFLYKSVTLLLRMRQIKRVYDLKLKIKQKEMENIKFEEIINRLIELQRSENFSRVKENLTTYDVIARITRKENFIIGLISNQVVSFNLRIPLIGTVDFYSNYIYNKLLESIMNNVFLKGDVNINMSFFNLRFFQFKLFTFILVEVCFMFPIVFYKIVFWIFKNVDNIKSNGNIMQRVWSSHVQIMFKNYNELPHHFEYRLNKSYVNTERFLNCFKERLFSIFGKFIIIICGSFLALIFILSTIDDRLFTDLKIYGNKLVWITFVIGFLLSIFGSKEQNPENYEEDYLENVTFKASHYKSIVNNVMNIPDEWKQTNNFSRIFKKISMDYVSNVKTIIKELCSIIIFPILWFKLIFQAKEMIKFFKLYSKKVTGLGTVCSFSVMNLNHYRCLKEKDLAFNQSDFNDRKFINSFINYNVRVKV